MAGGPDMDGLLLKFVDWRREEAFAESHKARLSHCMKIVMVVLISVGVLTILTAHRFWDASQYPTSHAQELSRWQFGLVVGSISFFVVMLSMGTGLSSRGRLSTFGMEIIVVSSCTIFMVVMCTIPKHYIARIFGHEDTHAVWEVELGGTDGNVVLYIDVCITALHLLLPIRWFVLIPMEFAAVLTYAGFAFVLGSPAMNMVPYNVIGLAALAFLAAVGKRSFEKQERVMFASLLEEKLMRFHAEFKLSNTMDATDAKTPAPEDARSSALSVADTTASGRAFMGVAGDDHVPSLDQIRAIGQREQWLLGNSEVEILPDQVLGKGGFGVVTMGTYYSTRVAVKAPREDVEVEMVNQSLPELCNELRILRYLRHRNIVFLYGACLDKGATRLCLVLEYVEGVTLGVFVRSLGKGRPTPSPTSSTSTQGFGRRDIARIQMISDILSALRYLHSRKPVVVHGDLKDANIFVEEARGMFSSGYRAKLLDFGLSRFVTRNARPLGGTVRWMAPELLCRGSAPVVPEAAADCYSLGQLLYFIAVGEQPYASLDADTVLKNVRRGKQLSLDWPETSRELVERCRPLADRCRQAKPALRPTAQQASEELAEMLAEVAIDGRRQSTRSQSSGSSSGAQPGNTTGKGSPAVTAITEQPASEAVESPPGTTIGKPSDPDTPPLETKCSSKEAAPGADAPPQEFGGLEPAGQLLDTGMRHVGCGTPCSLTPVLEHEELSGSLALVRRSSMSMSVPRTSSGPDRVDGNKRQRQLQVRQFEETPLSTQVLTLAFLLSQWNCSVPSMKCCWLHSALDALEKVRGELRRRKCSAPDYKQQIYGQCQNCKLLLMEGTQVCDFCGTGTEETSSS